MRSAQLVEAVNFDLFTAAQNFYVKGNEAFDNILYDERAAKEAMLMAYLARGAVALTGGPGGGKSTLGREGHRIFTDYFEGDLANIPPDSSLSAIQVVGGTMETNKVIEDSSGSRTEKTLTVVKGLILPQAKEVFIDEATRVNPLALNSVLAVAQEKVLKTTAGEVPLDDLQMIVTTLNPSETRQATFKIPTALAGRHNTGAVMGHDLTAANGRKIVNGILPNPENIVPFTSSKDLRKLNKAVRAYLLPETEADLAYRVGIATINYLEETHQIREENRVLGQIGLNAKIHGLFRQRTATPEDVYGGLKFVLAARIGMLVGGPNPYKTIDDAHEAILAKAA